MKLNFSYTNQIEDFFIREDVMSVHLKEGLAPIMKCGRPGNWKMEEGEEIVPSEKLYAIAEEIMERTYSSKEARLEYDYPSCSVIQSGKIRIVIARPPFSDALEITAVRPIVNLSLEDYSMSAELKQRFERAEGILIAGSPGEGKSTFSSALANFYSGKHRLVKTLERPRDLQVEARITQYSALEDDFRKTADILLLLRPDYVLFDELRKTTDFEVFSDLRLAGVGMLGVVHATTAIDAISRFISRIELGLIPQIVDTVIYIASGEIQKVLSLTMKVKLPHGFESSELARPVIEISDYETRNLEFEIYKFGEQTMIIPITEDFETASTLNDNDNSKKIIHRLKREIGYYTKRKFSIKPSNPLGKRYTVFAHPADISKLIGPRGRTISKLERTIGVSLDVREIGILEDSDSKITNEIASGEIDFTNKSIIIYFSNYLVQENVTIADNSGEKLFSGIVSETGKIKIDRQSDEGKIILKLLKQGRKLFWHVK